MQITSLSSSSSPINNALIGLDFTRSFYKNAFVTTSNFANLPGVTVTRASTGYAEDLQGNLVSFGNNVARITNKGLLVEESRTNILRWSGTPSSWGSGVGFSSTNNVTGPDGVANSAATVTQTGANGSDSRVQNNTTIANDNTTYTASWYTPKLSSTPAAFPGFVLSLTGGTTQATTLTLNPVTGSYVSSSPSVNVQSVGSWWRVSITQANNTSGNVIAAVMFYPAINSTLSTTVNTVTGVSNVIAFCQLEVGTFATSYIPTTTSAVTRQADQISITPPAALTSYTAYTNVLFNTAASSVASTFCTYIEGNGITGVTIGTQTAAPYPRLIARHGTVRTDSNGALPPGKDGAEMKCAIAADGGNVFMSNQGSTAISNQTPTQSDWAQVALWIGSRSGSNSFANTYIKQVFLFNYMMSQTQINALTTPSTQAYLDLNFADGSYKNTSGYTRTNYVTNSEMVGASVGVFPTGYGTGFNGGVTGVTAAVVATGTDTDGKYIDVRLNGTPSTSGSWVIVPAPGSVVNSGASIGQTWTFSSYVKLVAGSVSNTTFRIVVNENNSSAGYLTNSTTIYVPTSTLSRPFHTRTLNQATVAATYPSFNFDLTSGAAVDFTLRIYKPQFELTSYPTSWIPTTTAAASAISYSSTNLGDAGNLVCTRASTGYAEDNAGNMVLFQANTPRITNKGLLVEETRTNILTASYDDAPANIWSTLNLATVGTGTLSPRCPGATVTRMTTTGTDGRIQRNTTVPNDSLTRVFSVDVEKKNVTYQITTGIVGGSSGVGTTLTFNGLTGAISLGSSSITFLEDKGNWWRASVVVTNNGTGNTTHYIFVQLLGASGQTADVSIPDVQVGAFPTSYIPSRAGSSVTRPQDVVYMSGVGISGANRFALAAQADTCVALADQRFVELYTTTSNRMILRRPGTTSGTLCVTASSVLAETETGVVQPGGRQTLCGSYDGATFYGMATGGSYKNLSSSAISGVMDNLGLGSQGPGATGPINGYLRFAQVYKTNLSASEMDKIIGASDNHLSLNFMNNTYKNAVGYTRTNLSINSADPAQWGSSGTSLGITVTRVGTGTENGMPYADYQFSGTSSSNGGCGVRLTSADHTSLANTTYTASFYIKQVGGSTANLGNIVIPLVEYTSGGAYVGETQCVIYGINTTSYVKASATRTNGATGQKNSVWLTVQFGNAAAINITYRVYGPQVEAGTVATTWIPTGAISASATTYSGSSFGDTGSVSFSRNSIGYAEDRDGNLKAFAVNVPRITNKGLLVEEGRTNSFLYSEQFDNAAWVKNFVNVTTNQAVAPDGNTTADLILTDNSLNYHYVQQVGTTATTVSNSVYVKPYNARYVVIEVRDDATYVNGGFAVFDIQLGRVTTYGNVGTGTGTFANIQVFNNGWMRLSITMTQASSLLTRSRILFSDSPSGATSFQSGGLGAYFWGAQSEGGSITLSYIPTTATAASRSSDDVIYFTPSNNVTTYNNDFTYYVAGSPGIRSPSTTQRIGGPHASFGGGDNNNRIHALLNANGTAQFFLTAAGSAQTYTYGSPFYLNGTRVKFAFRKSGTTWSPSTAGLYSSSYNITNALPTGLDSLRIGRDAGSNLIWWNGFVEEVKLIPYAVTDYDLRNITRNIDTASMRFDFKNQQFYAAQDFARTRSNHSLNSTFQGVVPGVVGSGGVVPGSTVSTTMSSLTATINGTGTENGMPYVEIRFSGTPNITSYYNFSFQNSVPALNGETWTNSMYIKLQAGSMTNVSSATIQINENNNSTYLTGGSTGATITSNITRFWYTRTLSGGGTVNNIGQIFTFRGTLNQPIDMTLRFYAPMFERTKYPTTWIPTYNTGLPGIVVSSSSNNIADIGNFSFTRPSIGYAEDINGNLTLFYGNVPRITNKGFLIEESRTNLLLQGGDLNTTWAKVSGATVSYSPGAPDKSASFSKVTAAGGVNSSRVQQSFNVSTATTYMFSVYISPDTAASCRLAVFDGGVGTQIAAIAVNWTNGYPSLGTINGTFSVAPNLIPAGPGVWRLTAGVDSGAFTSLAMLLYPDYTAGVNSTKFWGAQAEAGMFPTSYIPTTSATVTRAQDVASMDYVNAVASSSLAAIATGPTNAGSPNNVRSLALAGSTNDDLLNVSINQINSPNAAAAGFTVSQVGPATSYGSPVAAAAFFNGTAMKGAGFGQAATNVTGTYSGATNTALIRFGDTAGNVRTLCGYLQSGAIYAYPFGDDELQYRGSGNLV